MRKIKMLLNAAWAIPAVFLIRLLRPYVFIRFGHLTTLRVHFMMQTLELNERLKSQETNEVSLFWLGICCNDQWKKMAIRHLPIYSWVKYLDRWNRMIPGGEVHYYPVSVSAGDRDLHGLYQKGKGALPFLSSERNEAVKWLVNQGWSEGKPFVCILVRDDAYITSLYKDKGKRSSFENDTFRNSDIETYQKAMRWLADQGIWVLRMGKVMKKRISISHPKIIDYAFHDGKNDLLDIWLFANCTACISTGTGVDMVSSMYNRPVCFLNVMPLSSIATYGNSYWVPKNLSFKASGMPLTVQDRLSYNPTCLDNSQLEDINIVDLTEDEIMECVKEFWEINNNNYVETREDMELRKKFWHVLQSMPDYSKQHGFVHPKCRMSPLWLRSQDDGFFNERVEKPSDEKAKVCVN